ncbi:hypothetical protein F0365_15730 [Nonlabens sp. Ci31]|jgi:hypothetical protein|uniref:hypothetical protein n=1 Tax=Nonlabens sp. Ci31 TaxID=2608253 RepID=UPI00146308D6|nr:hypothetical protein [Nonlabens sp. Ci31]QJP35746.1 hypothetical protein F0365_15730 [Nonlabens sp. Ci31]
MAVRKRNPILGGLMAAAFIGFGSYRLYRYYVLAEEMPSWQLVLGYGIVAYGLYLVYALIAQKDA